MDSAPSSKFGKIFRKATQSCDESPVIRGKMEERGEDLMQYLEKLSNLTTIQDVNEEMICPICYDVELTGER